MNKSVLGEIEASLFHGTERNGPNRWYLSDLGDKKYIKYPLCPRNFGRGDNQGTQERAIGDGHGMIWKKETTSPLNQLT